MYSSEIVIKSMKTNIICLIKLWSNLEHQTHKILIGQ